MIRYERREDGSYLISLCDIVIGTATYHIGVLRGDPSYWEFDKSTSAPGKPMNLRGCDLRSLKMIVLVYVRSIIEKGLQHA